VVIGRSFIKTCLNNDFSVDTETLERHLGVPDEIKAEGAVAVGSYLERLGDEVEQLDEARIIILGEKGAGKTSLARKLRYPKAQLPKEDDSTEGVETHIWSFLDKDGSRMVNAHIWDFAKYSITHSAHRCFMSARCLYIYVYNGRIERGNDPIYWLEQIRIHGRDTSRILFLVNERDRNKAVIDEKTLKKEYPSIAGYYHANIGNEDTVELEKFRQAVMDTVRNNLAWNSQIVSKEAYKIKNKLLNSFKNNNSPSPFIEMGEFESIAKVCGTPDERIKDILHDLHTLSICLWYNMDGMKESNTLVYNPVWITNCIYRIINKGYEQHKHILTVENGAEILKGDKKYKYPFDKVKYLFRLMVFYELALFYEQKRDCVFIPRILPIDMPDQLPSFEGALKMCFTIEKFMPPNIVGKIMVRPGNDIDENLSWRKAAVLKYHDGDATALITEEMQKIIVEVKGKDETLYIKALREIIKDIF